MASTDLAPPQVRPLREDESTAALHGDGRRLTPARLRGPVTTWSLLAAALAAVAQAIGTVVTGRVAAGPTVPLVALLALCVVGAALLDTVGRAAWAGVVDRAEGRLRGDLLA